MPVDAATIEERRQHIRDTARCRQCGSDQKSCIRAMQANGGGPEGICCFGGIPGHGHVEDKRMTDDLMREITAGKVRTVAEAYPPPVQGPLLPSMAWLLDQKVWWAPHRRPMVRIANMDKPWRFNTVRLLEHKAPELHRGVGGRYMWDAPDDVWASFDNESPLEWLRDQPLMQRLMHKLPHPESRKGRELANRAVHWNTCPMRKAHPEARDRCVCIRNPGGWKVVGATNDPQATGMA